MSQNATLSNPTRTPFEVDAGCCAFESEPKSASAISAVYSAIWELCVTAFMLILAPLVLVALAGAFVVACLRMHGSEVGTDFEHANAPVSIPPVKQGGLHASRAGARSFGGVGRSHLVKPPTSEHLWN